MTINYKPWGIHQDKEVYLFTLKNEDGSYVALTNYGATIAAIAVPGKNGELVNTILGFDNLEAYVNDRCYIGSTIGRVANRIANAGFSLGDNHYGLDRNDGDHSNHGGHAGFNTQVFDFEVLADAVLFKLYSKAGSGGYPGNLQLAVKYSWTNAHQLHIDYHAEVDKLTIANFTNHAYFNLSGGKTDILQHILAVPADKVLEANEQYIPTGNIIDPGDRVLNGVQVQDKLFTGNGKPQGINQYYIIKAQADVDRKRLAASLTCDQSGLLLNVYTTYPGLMVYTGDFLESNYQGLAFKKYKPFDGICLECQFYPDAVHHQHFTKIELDPADHYHEQIIYKFKTLS